MVGLRRVGAVAPGGNSRWIVSRQERHLCYVWDGERIATVYEKKPVQV